MEVLMVQDLPDVLCTAGKQSAVLSLFPFHFPSRFPLPISLSLIPLLLHPSPTVTSHLPPQPFHSLPFSISVCSLLLPYVPLPSPNSPFPFVSSLLYSLPVFTGPFFPYSLFPSYSLSPFNPSHSSLLSLFPLHRPLPLFSPLSPILIFPHNTSPSHSVFKAAMFSSFVIDSNQFKPFKAKTTTPLRVPSLR